MTERMTEGGEDGAKEERGGGWCGISRLFIQGFYGDCGVYFRSILLIELW